LDSNFKCELLRTLTLPSLSVALDPPFTLAGAFRFSTTGSRATATAALVRNERLAAVFPFAISGPPRRAYQRNDVPLEWMGFAL
jgi:hypothetical protein